MSKQYEMEFQLTVGFLRMLVLLAPGPDNL